MTIKMVALPHIRVIVDGRWVLRGKEGDSQSRNVDSFMRTYFSEANWNVDEIRTTRIESRNAGVIRNHHAGPYIHYILEVIRSQ
jgi:hypothetical protein